MKIFISHASANKQYGDALLELLRGVGISENQIIYTSNPAYGIPISQNIFKWLKTQISEKPFVIYLLSKEYYASIACLNEMGAAWIIENEHAIIFTPGFNIDSKEFQNGAIDPRELGFYLDDHNRLLTFLQLLQQHFTVTSNAILINQKITTFLKAVDEAKNTPKPQLKDFPLANDTLMEAFDDKSSIKVAEINKTPSAQHSQINVQKKPIGLYEKFINEVSAKKLKDEELMLLKYIIETGKIKLGTGWQEQHESSKIGIWEDVNDISSMLSSNYGIALGKFEVRGYTETSAYTSSNNPKEVILKPEIADNILDLPNDALAVINEIFEKYKNTNEDDDFAF